MKQAFIDFQKQFAYNPVIKNKKRYKIAKKYILLGMGGSHLAADVIKNIDPSIEMLVHSDYDLPAISDRKLKNYLIIASSYSGNTEEVVSGLKLAHKNKLNIVVIATGGKLIKFAQDNKLAYIQMPDFGIQPRSALGFSCRALLKAMGQHKLYKETALLAKTLKGKNYEARGKKLAKTLKGKVPIIYASTNNFSLAYNWKIKFNETGKIPAFYNVFPELNHNEMTGFDVAPQTKDLSKNYCFIFIRDDKDHKQNKKRMDVVAKLYKKRKLAIINIKLAGKNKWLQIFSNLLIADWASYYTSQGYSLEAEQVPMVEDFKRLL